MYSNRLLFFVAVFHIIQLRIDIIIQNLWKLLFHVEEYLFDNKV
ncbi:hypothetical protein SAMN05192585_10378 [Acetanaerobacterium elongatum]|uniref:Uncharacterized protein n=1 Tax=Acetanaerobacterium elongatum TaxID=258515 RepID=A0A1G9V7X5_9FIRM|nr:hypothetical protein SAMN05192585_10378 [Acetanaerobacterium elongatum]